MVLGYFCSFDMLSLSIKLDAPVLAAREGIEAVDSEGWMEIAEEVSYFRLPRELKQVSSLLSRIHNRALKVDSLYITDYEDRISNHGKRIKLKKELLEVLMNHNSNFSYGLFSSHYKKSNYKLGNFFIVSFERNLEDKIHRIVARMSNECGFNVWMFNSGGNQPYVIFDAREYGLEHFFHEAAQKIRTSQRRKLFRLAYFTNSPWCSIDIDADTISDIVKLNASLELTVYQKMNRPKLGKELPFWNHVVCMAKKYLTYH